MANYLVTGGCGFIGSHLCEALFHAGHNVTILDDLSTGKESNINCPANLIIGNITHKDTVKHAMEDIDGVFHLAAIASVEKSVEQWAETHMVNLSGTINIFDCAKDQKVPVVYASSAAVYGDNANVPLIETDRTSPLSAYGADKLGCELHAKVAGLVHGVPSAGLRFFNVFGPRQDPKSPYSGVISIFIDRLIEGASLKIFGDGQQVRDFVYVGDVVRFLMAAMKNTSINADVYNVCTGKKTSVAQLASTLAMIADTKLSVERHPARMGDIQMSLGDPTKAMRKLGIVAETAFFDALRATYEYQLPTNQTAIIYSNFPKPVGYVQGNSLHQAINRDLV